jgi:hypothetical protein
VEGDGDTHLEKMVELSSYFPPLPEELVQHFTEFLKIEDVCNFAHALGPKGKQFIEERLGVFCFDLEKNDKAFKSMSRFVMKHTLRRVRIRIIEGYHSTISPVMEDVFIIIMLMTQPISDLDLSTYEFEDEDLTCLVNSLHLRTTLEHFIVKRAGKVLLRYVQYLQNLRTLEAGALRRDGLFEVPKNLKPLPQLRRCCLRNTRVTKALLRWLSRLESLDTLILTDCTFERGATSEVPDFPALQTLDATASSFADPETFAALLKAARSTLVDLSLRFVKFPKGTNLAWGEFNDLQSLNLEDAVVPPEVLKGLSGLRKLQVLYLGSLMVGDGDNFIPATDEMMPDFRESQHNFGLDTLDLRDNPGITGTCIPNFFPSKLRKLVLDGCHNISGKGIQNSCLVPVLSMKRICWLDPWFLQRQ